MELSKKQKNLIANILKNGIPILILLFILNFFYQETRKYDFVGVWFPDYEDDITIQFNPDYSGVYYDDLTKIAFHWKNHGNQLEMTMNDETKVYRYTIEGKDIHLQSDDESFILYKCPEVLGLQA